MPENKVLVLIGRAEVVDFPKLNIVSIPARIDTGARTSSIWASNIQEEHGTLHFTLFAKGSKYYTGEVISTKEYSQLVVASSMGQPDIRYKVKLVVKLHGKKIRASFTLANRSTQTYPILVGRNVLRGKFVVDVKKGKPLMAKEKTRITALQALLNKKGKVV